jgi:hypothetical protein
MLSDVVTFRYYQTVEKKESAYIGAHIRERAIDYSFAEANAVADKTFKLLEIHLVVDVNPKAVITLLSVIME